MTSCIHLIRHGITEGILGKYFYGWRDLPVVKEGYDELDELKRAGIYPEVPEDTLFYTSGMKRANQTLEYIYGDVPYMVNEKIKEINFGEWEMKTWHDLEHLGLWKEWMTDTTGEFTFPGGDSMIGFVKRVNEGGDEIIKAHRMKELSHRHSGLPAVSVVVCHGGAISAMMTKWFPEDKPYLMSWTPETGRGYTVYLEGGEPARYEEISMGKEKSAVADL